MKKMWCDLCGKEIGVKYSSFKLYWGEPIPDQFLDENDRRKDMCSDCEKQISRAVHRTVERIKKKSNICEKTKA